MCFVPFVCNITSKRRTVSLDDHFVLLCMSLLRCCVVYGCCYGCVSCFVLVMSHLFLQISQARSTLVYFLDSLVSPDDPPEYDGVPSLLLKSGVRDESAGNSGVENGESSIFLFVVSAHFITPNIAALTSQALE